MGNNCCYSTRDCPADYAALKSLNRPMQQQDESIQFEQKTVKASKSIVDALELQSNVVDLTILPAQSTDFLDNYPMRTKGKSFSYKQRGGLCIEIERLSDYGANKSHRQSGRDRSDKWSLKSSSDQGSNANEN